MNLVRSTKANLRLFAFCLFMILSLVVLFTVLVWSAGQQNVSSQIPIELEARVKITYAQNTDSDITSEKCEVKFNDEKTQFKVVVPTTDYVNTDNAEFYYFCTNSNVTTSTSYVDPGTVYWASTDTLENWYDVPSNTLNLYTCFMTPNYTTAEAYTGTDTQIIVSNSITSIPFKAFYGNTTIINVILPQSVRNVGYGDTDTDYGAFQGCTALTKIVLPRSVKQIGKGTFKECTALTSVTFVDTSSQWTTSDGTSPVSLSVTDSATNATNLVTTYAGYSWSYGIVT